MIKVHDRAEFVGQVIDIFEDFLEDRGIQLPNLERIEAEENGDEPAIIYGCDYGELQDYLESMFRSWRVLEEEPIC